VFVVDSSDPDRLVEAREELSCLLAEPALRELRALMVLGNKTDLHEALERDQLIDALGLRPSIEGEEGRRIEVFRRSLVDGTGYLEAFKWLSATLLAAPK